MSHTVTLELPENVAQTARQIADRTRRPVEEVLVDWLDRTATDLPVEGLPDEQLMHIAQSTLPSQLQDELSALLIRNREGELKWQDKPRLETLMQLYRTGLVRKARATRAAVERGLLPGLN